MTEQLVVYTTDRIAIDIYIYHQGWIVLDMSENFRAFELALVMNNLHLQGGQAVNC